MQNAPKLTGTAEEIAQATMIRKATVNRLKKQIERALALRPDVSSDQAAQLRAVPGIFLEKSTQASWWIENQRTLVKLAFSQIVK